MQVDEELPGLAAAMQRAPPPVEVGDALGFLPAAHGEQRVGWRPVEWMELHGEYVKEVDAHAAQVRTRVLRDCWGSFWGFPFRKP